MSLNTKFFHLFWHYTNSNENLFMLEPDELAVFKQLVMLAERK